MLLEVEGLQHIGVLLGHVALRSVLAVDLDDELGFAFLLRAAHAGDQGL